MQVHYLPYIALGISLALCATAALLSRGYARRMAATVDKVLDHVLQKKPLPAADTIGDDYLSKVAHKANRVVDILATDALRAQQDMQTIQGFLADLSFQMKTPLAGIITYSELLMEGGLSVQESGALPGRIHTAAYSLHWMMDCLAKISRLEAGLIALCPRAQGIRETLGAGVDAVRAPAARSQILISIENFEDRPLYHDRKWRQEAFANVLENALKYSPEGGTVAISVEALALYTKVNIKDRGIGIPPGELNMVFQRFYRGSNARDSEGTGLGLYLASLILRNQNGYIAAASGPKKGTVFSLFFQNCKN